MMDNPGAGAAPPRVGHAEEVHDGRGPSRARPVAEPVAFASGCAETHDVGQQLRGILVALLGEGDPVDAAQGVRLGDRAAGRGGGIPSCIFATISTFIPSGSAKPKT